MQQHIDFTLFDDAIGFGGHASAGEQIANVAQLPGLVGAAMTARSGDLARLLASMSAAVAQRLETL